MGSLVDPRKKISQVKDRPIEITQTEKQKEKQEWKDHQRRGHLRIVGIQPIKLESADEVKERKDRTISNNFGQEFPKFLTYKNCSPRIS